MRKSELEKQAVSDQVRQKLCELAKTGGIMLPMPHDIERIGDGRGVSHVEWEEWTQRRALHRETNLDYEKTFSRPSDQTATRVWELLGEFKFPNLEWPNDCHTFIPEGARAVRTAAAKQGLVIVLDTFLRASFGPGQITYREVFDALCGSFSDHFAAKRKTIDSVRDMRPETVTMCRRDLLLMGVVPKYLWVAVVGWSNNPLFQVKEHNTGSRVVTRVLLPVAGEAVLGRYRQIVERDTAYLPPAHSGIRLSFADEPLGKFEEVRSKFCAERPYNIVELGENSKELLNRQSAAILYLDVSAFKYDYDQARANEKYAEDRLKKEFRIDARLFSSPRTFRMRTGGKDTTQSRWSERSERVYYRSIELGILRNASLTPSLADCRNYEKLIKCRGHIKKLEKWLGSTDHDPSEDDIRKWLKDGSDKTILEWLGHNEQRFDESSAVTPEMAYFQMDKAMTEWRDDVRGLIEIYDAARLHQKVFQHVHERVKDLDGMKEIHSGFRRLITRRYQPLHFWPTYVTSKERSQLSGGNDEGIGTSSKKSLESYRNRWFKGKDPETGKSCELVGFDISSSQMQIIAVLMGDEELEKVTMTSLDQPSFKEAMANLAWEMHQSRKLELRAGGGEIIQYSGGFDDRLQELVKELLMRVCYGSAWPIVEMDQRCHPNTYGPGWETGSAGKFVEAFNREYPGPAEFRKICSLGAKASYAKNKYQGIEFVDPFDGAKVRWNPVDRDDEYPAGSGGDGLRISVPRGLPRRSKSKKAPLSRAIEGTDGLACKKAPYFGDYEVDEEELKKMAAPCLVHVLDAYYSSLVMSRLVSRGVDCFVGIHDCWLVPESKIDVLKEAMDHAGRDWYEGIEPVYEALLCHLKTDDEDDKTASGKGKKETKEAYLSVSLAQEKWKQRMIQDWRPRFRYKKVVAKPTESKH